MNNENYNGWTNYETWRINLEIFDEGYDEFDTYTVEMLKEYVEGLLECTNNLTESYALAFVSNVNYHEILKHIQEEKQEGDNNE